MEEVTSIIKKGKQTKNHETMKTNFESYWNFLKWMSKSQEGNPLLVTQKKPCMCGPTLFKIAALKYPRHLNSSHCSLGCLKGTCPRNLLIIDGQNSQNHSYQSFQLWKLWSPIFGHGHINGDITGNGHRAFNTFCCIVFGSWARRIIVSARVPSNSWSCHQTWPKKKCTIYKWFSP